jgi:hypothetical protein
MDDDDDRIDAEEIAERHLDRVCAHFAAEYGLTQREIYFILHQKAAEILAEQLSHWDNPDA